MSDQQATLLAKYGQHILGYDQARAHAMIGIFHDTMEAMRLDGIPMEEIIWAMIGMVIAWVREHDTDRLDRINLVQAMIIVRMGMMDKIEAEDNAGKAH